MFTQYRQSVRSLIAAAFFSLGMTDAMAVERKFETRIGIVSIEAEDEWKIINVEPEGMSGVAFELGSGGQKMQFMLVTTNEPGNQELSVATARQLAEELRKQEIADGIRAEEVRSFTGSQFVGHYFHGAGVPRPNPKPGEFTWQISGILVTPTAPLVFTIAWNEGGKPAADRAFAAVKKLKLSKR